MGCGDFREIRVRNGLKCQISMLFSDSGKWKMEVSRFIRVMGGLIKFFTSSIKVVSRVV